VFEEQAKKNNIYPFVDWADVLKGRTLRPGAKSFLIPTQGDKK
jgi:hypothetical protein